MLGRLFNSASSTAATSPSGTRPSTSHALESDELYTRNLLYPDSNSSVASSFHSSYSLSQSTSSSSASSFGDNIDLEAVRDVRVIIAQDAVASEHKVVVYDSKPCTVSPQGSVAPGDSDGPMSPTMGGPYGRSRRKNPQHASVLCGPDDELKGFTDCMFGVAPLSYRGPSTKVHILPSIEDRRPSTLTSPISSRRGSLRDDRSAGAQYYGLKALPQPQPAKEKRKSILITRLFSVTIPPCPPPAVFEGGRNIPQSNSGEHTSTPTSSVGSTSGFPFPKAGGQTSAGSSSTHRVPKQSKSTMYGVGLIISLPPTASALSSFTMHCCYHKPSDSDIPHRHEYCCTTPPSFEDEYHSPPQVGFNMECGLDAQSASSVNDGRMDLITKHWDVITRALSDLQRVAQERILENLTVARLQSPQPAPSSSGIRYLSSRAEMRKMGLMRDDILRSEVEHLRWRVVTGIRVPRVVVGQGRWDLWQEEAKWANQRFGGRDMNFFFLTLLTAFLGHHTDWLDVLGPELYKRRHLQQLKSRPNPEDSAIPTRTVLLSTDRIAARKLIYLLSAFLPGKASHGTPDVRSPSRTSSINYLSQSPPNFTAAGITSTPGSRFGSLRRKARKKPSKLNMAVSSETDEADDGPDSLAGWAFPAESNTSSSAVSVLQLPLGPGCSRNCESTGTLTTLPSSATCAASAPAGLRRMSVRPSSSGSVASVILKSTLKRTGAANTSMESGTTWGSFLSFWGNPKSRSSSNSNPQPEDYTKHCSNPNNEATLDMLVDDDQLNNMPPFSPVLPNGSSYPLMDQLSVDDSDGAINVPLDLTFPSFTSPLSSPPTASWAMPSIQSGLGGPSRSFVTSLPPTVNPTEDDSACNVAGWIDEERFHPDFLLQAVKPYAEVEADIKRAMRMEPTPPLNSQTPWSEGDNSPGSEKWITVSEVLIADTKRLQIKRLRLRRRVKRPAGCMITPQPCHYQKFLQPDGILTPTPSVDDEDLEDDEFEEEIVCDVDDTLATAIEKVISGEDQASFGCRSTVLGALERVVGDVVNGEPSERWGGNVLTEGVGKWICGVDEAA